MEKNKSTSSLYKYALIYFILFSLTLIFVYLIMIQKELNFKPIVLLSFLILILISNSFFMLYLIKKCFISTRRYERNALELLKYKYLENDLKTYRQHRHDMKNHLSIIYDLVQREKYDELKDYTKAYLYQTEQKLKTVSCGSDEIDVLLYHKINQAKDHHIPVDYHIKPVFKVPYATMMDFVSIFSNLLDNAIEANLKLKDVKDRTLNITIDDDAIDYKIVITNAFKKHMNPQRFLEDGFTTKDNKENHGLGLGIVEKIVQRYKGQSHIEILNDAFYQVKIEIPKHNVH